MKKNTVMNAEHSALQLIFKIALEKRRYLYKMDDGP